MRKRGNKRLRKKGLSAVVTTLVIILLVLVSIGIIWVVIKNLIVGGVEEISLGKFSTELNIKSVKVEGDVLSVGVERAVGKGNLVKLKFIFENGTDSEIIERETDIEELDEKSFIFGLGDLSLLGIKKVSIVPIYKSSSGKEVSGDIIDIFELKKPIREEAGTWEYIGNFARFGFEDFGRREYRVSSSGEIPTFTNVIVDPLDVHVGDTQTFIAYVTSPHEITEVTTTTQLDNEVLELPLEKTENENEYMGSWIVYDTHVTIYRTTFIARDSEGNENTVEMSWTDPCTVLSDHGTTTTIDTPCVVGVNFVDGVDAGNIILTSGLTLESNSTFIKTPGYIMTNSGSVTFSGGVLQAGYIYYVDTDEDNYGLGYEWRATGGDNWAGHVLANSAIGENDCNNNDGDVNTNVGSLRWDSDQDGWTGDGAATECVGGTTSVGGRTYYMDTSGGYGWLSGAPLGTSDCNEGDNARWRDRYTDSDNDGYCPNSGQTCVGTHSGYRDSCTTYTDCNDGSSSVWVDRTCYLDADNDGYTTGGSVSVCKGSACNSPTGHQASQTATDCSAADNTRWRNRYRDADGDAYCLGSGQTCVGNHAGYRDSCTSYSDCNDNSGSVQVNKYYDGDWDGYCTSGTPTSCVAAGAGNPYRTSCTGYSDCNDGSGFVYQNVANLVADEDHDRYSTGSSATRCVGGIQSTYWYRNIAADYKWITTANRYGSVDCCSSDRNVNPGQTNWFTTNVWIDCPNSWDYNCDGDDEMQYTNTYGGCRSCSPSGEFCSMGGGGVGWSGSARACGSSGTYYTSRGMCPPEPPCTVSGCSSETRTQACR